ncbi:MAG TPA: STAS domain-containing protein [Phycisphaerae bacterium]|nr:STAS domain-containing protein [Phycisphaerae bacterium]
MAEEQPHLSITSKDGVHIVEFSDRKILEELSIRNIEEELSTLVAAEEGIKLLLNFKNVEHLSSAALGMLINLEKEVAHKNGKLILSDIRPQIYEVFRITRLHKMFEIHDSVGQAMKHF